MTRVSEGSSTASIKYSINKAKQKLENLQLKGSTLKSMTKPSDNAVSNIEAMQLSSISTDNKQFLRNADFALMQLSVTEKALENLTDILVKAKEIAIAQSSDIYNPEVRQNVSNEVKQLKNLAISIANKRVGQKFLFAGFKSLETPFDKDGNYKGDTGHTTLEVSKDFFVQTNLHGAEVFFADEGFDSSETHPLNKFPELQSSPKNPANEVKYNEEFDNPEISRDLASVGPSEEQEAPKFEKRENIFSLLESLGNSLENNEPKTIQNLLEKFDDAISRLITMRTRVGSISNSVMNSQNTIESDNIDNATRTSKLVDADVADLFADLQKQQEVLKTTYKSTQGLLNQRLIDFIK